MRSFFNPQTALCKVTPTARTLSACAVAVFVIYSLHNGICKHWLTTLRPETAQLIFVGGHEGSGTGLMRVMLDAHPLIRCGAEPMVTMDVLGLRNTLAKSQRAIKAGIYPDAYNEATAYFILKIIEKMGPPAKFLCHKQPASFIHLAYLSEIFPKAKFVHMLRDGRGAIASIMKRGFNGDYAVDNPAGAMKLWEMIVTLMLRECQEVGSKRCLSIRYERLVMNPENESKKLFEFLEIPWDASVLRHETMISQLTNLNPYEPSTGQITKKIYNDSIAKWAEPDSVLNKTFLHLVVNQSTLLRALGYADLGSPPNYAKLNSSVPFIV